MLVFAVHGLMLVHHVYITFVMASLNFDLPEAKVKIVNPINNTEEFVLDPKLIVADRYPFAYLTLWNFVSKKSV